MAENAAQRSPAQIWADLSSNILSGHILSGLFFTARLFFRQDVPRPDFSRQYVSWPFCFPFHFRATTPAHNSFSRHEKRQRPDKGIAARLQDNVSTLLFFRLGTPSPWSPRSMVAFRGSFLFVQKAAKYCWKEFSSYHVLAGSTMLGSFSTRRWRTSCGR